MHNGNHNGFHPDLLSAAQLSAAQLGLAFPLVKPAGSSRAWLRTFTP